MRKISKYEWVLLALLLLVLTHIPRYLYDDDTFDQVEWNRSPCCSTWVCSRGRMVDDLSANHLKVGMTRTDVQKILGSPNTEGGFNADCFDLGACAGLEPVIFCANYDKSGNYINSDLRGEGASARYIRWIHNKFR